MSTRSMPSSAPRERIGSPNGEYARVPPKNPLPTLLTNTTYAVFSSYLAGRTVSMYLLEPSLDAAATIIRPAP